MRGGSIGVFIYFGGVKEETTALGPGVEARVGDDGAGDCFLGEAQEDAGGLGEECAGVAEAAFEGGGDAVEAGGGGRELGGVY